MVAPSLLEPTSRNVEPPWVDIPTRRGTFELLISCVLTLVLCVWTAVHPDVPAPNRRGFWYCLTTRSLWLVIGLLAPEYLLWQAIRQYLEARNICKRLAELPFKARDIEYSRLISVLIFSLRTADGYGPPVLQLKPEMVMKLVEFGVIAQHSDLLKQEPIRDKSKADNLAKLLVCVQASWMIIQCIARKCTGLPVTLLEINAVMHVVCALFMYFLWLEKPQEANIPPVALSWPSSSQPTAGGVMPPVTPNSSPATMSGGDSLTDLWENKRNLVWMAVLTAVYGSLHLIPWNSHFPTALERDLWRASCCVIAAGVLGSWLVIAVAYAVYAYPITIFYDVCRYWFLPSRGYLERSGLIPWDYFSILMVQFVVLPTYTLARAFVFIEGFASLRSLPQGACDTVPWTEFWPHF
ncbi:hypothetical protein BDZ91DRAFT_664718 [Kalaharituber pfeilii]|nr:hypothetical protein BDZ91DRAFT_664718 [Kalaharituber pfeilii]